MKVDAGIIQNLYFKAVKAKNQSLAALCFQALEEGRPSPAWAEIEERHAGK